jgi:hypothetical protein
MNCSSSRSTWRAGLVATLAVATLAVATMLVTAASAADGEGAEAPASAKPEEGATEGENAGDPNTGALSITFDNSLTTAYMFRGIMNERDGLIWQPSVALSFNLYEAAESVVESVDFSIATWLSVHSEETFESGNGPDAIYEADYYPSLSVSWTGGLTTALTYYFYTSPNGAFDTVEEVVVDLSFDDSDLLGPFALNPTASFVFETELSSFGGTGKGAVFELGLEPGVEVTLPMEGAEDYPIGLTFPFKIGLSMDDYYRNGPEDDVFGYARLGFHLGIPLAFLPPRSGDWSITNGIDAYFLGDAVHEYTKDTFGMADTFYPVWTSSLTLEY